MELDPVETSRVGNDPGLSRFATEKTSQGPTKSSSSTSSKTKMSTEVVPAAGFARRGTRAITESLSFGNEAGAYHHAASKRGSASLVGEIRRADRGQ